ISYYLLDLVKTNKDRAFERLQQLIIITKTKKDKEGYENKLFDKIITGLEKRIINIVDEQVKKGRLSNLELRLKQAGVENTSTSSFWSRSIIYGLIASMVGIFLGKALFVLIFFGLGMYYPFMKLNEKIKKR